MAHQNTVYYASKTRHDIKKKKKSKIAKYNPNNLQLLQPSGALDFKLEKKKVTLKASNSTVT